jgi:hypothetical protein
MKLINVLVISNHLSITLTIHSSYKPTDSAGEVSRLYYILVEEETTTVSKLITGRSKWKNDEKRKHRTPSVVREHQHQAVVPEETLQVRSHQEIPTR